MKNICGTNIKDRIFNQIRIKMEYSNHHEGRKTIVSIQKIVGVAEKLSHKSNCIRKKKRMWILFSGLQHQLNLSKTEVIDYQQKVIENQQEIEDIY